MNDAKNEEDKVIRTKCVKKAFRVECQIHFCETENSALLGHLSRACIFIFCETEKKKSRESQSDSWEQTSERSPSNAKNFVSSLSVGEAVCPPNPVQTHNLKETRDTRARARVNLRKRKRKEKGKKKRNGKQFVRFKKSPKLGEK